MAVRSWLGRRFSSPPSGAVRHVWRTAPLRVSRRKNPPAASNSKFKDGFPSSFHNRASRASCGIGEGPLSSSVRSCRAVLYPALTTGLHSCTGVFIVSPLVPAAPASGGLAESAAVRSCSRRGEADIELRVVRLGGDAGSVRGLLAEPVDVLGRVRRDVRQVLRRRMNSRIEPPAGTHVLAPVPQDGPQHDIEPLRGDRAGDGAHSPASASKATTSGGHPPKRRGRAGSSSDVTVRKTGSSQSAGRQTKAGLAKVSSGRGDR